MNVDIDQIVAAKIKSERTRFASRQKRLTLLSQVARSLASFHHWDAKQEPRQSHARDPRAVYHGTSGTVRKQMKNMRRQGTGPYEPK